MYFASGKSTDRVTNIESKDESLNLPTDSNTFVNALFEFNRLVKNCTWKNNECHKKYVKK
jgi:hypothetical protein